MADERYLAEALKYYTEVFRLVWVSILAIAGGTIGLLLGELSGLRIIAAIGGLVIVISFLEVLRRLNRQIGGLLSKLKESKDA
jgi:hypothetical protein